VKTGLCNNLVDKDLYKIGVIVIVGFVLWEETVGVFLYVV
jgi:hypothetical protein